ncbi:MAG: hypothetical protein JJU45_16885 [Acidimicrobiia bacterium]|nr:hypothetical protein [Acidimicrobiia bacterium]
MAERRAVAIVTKGTLVLRDLDLLQGYDRVRVLVSLPSFDDAALQQIEPQAPAVAERQATIEALYAAGVPVELHAQPWIPGVTDAEAMIDWAAGRFDVWFAPLALGNPVVARSGLGRRLTQGQVNEAYREARAVGGSRPRVRWSGPTWIGERITGTAGSAPAFDLGADDHLGRAATLMEAFGDGRSAAVTIRLISPHIRIFGASYPHRSTAAEGSRNVADLWGVAGALDGLEVTVEELRREGQVVRARFALSGTARRPIGGVRRGIPCALEVDWTLRFDLHGLVVEMWQSVSSLRPVACQVVVRQPEVSNSATRRFGAVSR